MHRTVLALAALPLIAACAQMDSRDCADIAAELAEVAQRAASGGFHAGKMAGLDARLASCREG